MPPSIKSAYADEGSGRARWGWRRASASDSKAGKTWTARDRRERLLCFFSSASFEPEFELRVISTLKCQRRRRIRIQDGRRLSGMRDEFVLRIKGGLSGLGADWVHHRSSVRLERTRRREGAYNMWTRMGMDVGRSWIWIETDLRRRSAHRGRPPRRDKYGGDSRGNSGIAAPRPKIILAERDFRGPTPRFGALPGNLVGTGKERRAGIRAYSIMAGFEDISEGGPNIGGVVPARHVEWCFEKLAVGLGWLREAEGRGALQIYRMGKWEGKQGEDEGRYREMN
ncbi:hypothetical protein DFH09DRAFT_1079161 [Mycena vulgaris]|nr:hypothetical protein DFH09DRAFT_1079161 [Mycena vulgaris]